MECNVTSIKKKTAAFTLVEILVSVAIGSIVLVALSQLIFYTGRSFAALYNYIELDKFSRNALDQMVYKIRQSDSLTSYTATRLIFSYDTTNTLTYQYLPDAKTLTETLVTPSGTTTRKTLLRGCDQLQFSVFQRNTASGTYDQFPATADSATKLVQLSWICSRTVLGARINSESVQSAKIVIRNP